jgi:cell division protein ZapA
VSGADKPGEKDSARLNVRILEREYLVACPQAERAALLDSAELLNSRMREIRDSGKVVGLDRIAVIAALNLANELIKLQNRDQRVEAELGNRVRGLRDRIEGELARGQQLEL